jgi:hypothetical protein
MFVGYVLLFPDFFGIFSLCDQIQFFQGEYHCTAKFGIGIGRSLYWALPFVAFSFFLLAVLPQTYKDWKKFGLWALPLAVVLTALTPVYGESFGPLLARDQMASFLSQVYLGISVIIISYSFWKQRSD